MALRRPNSLTIALPRGALPIGTAYLLASVSERQIGPADLILIQLRHYCKESVLSRICRTDIGDYQHRMAVTQLVRETSKRSVDLFLVAALFSADIRRSRIVWC